MLIVPAGKKSLLYSAYAPVIYLIVYFENLVRWAVHSWDGIVELLSFLFSLHYSLSHYGKTYKEKAE